MNDRSGFSYCRRTAALCIAAFALSALAPLHAQTPGKADKFGDEVVSRTQEYIRINTTNPPGNESKTAEFFARIFAQEGIPFDTASSAPGHVAGLRKELDAAQRLLHALLAVNRH